MEVKIKQYLGNATVGVARKAPAGGTQTPAVAGEETQAKSGAEPSLQMRGLKERVAAAPVADSARVANVSGRIQSGSYQIDPQRVAHKMMEAEFALP